MTERGLTENTPDVAVTDRQELFASMRQVMESFIDELSGVPERWLETPVTLGFTTGAHGEGFVLHPFGSLLSTSGLQEGWRSPAIHRHLDENRRRLVVDVELPGIDRDDVQLDVGPDHIRLEADGNLARFKALFELGTHVDPGRATATCESGLLHIEAPLMTPQPSRIRHVPIQ